MCLTERASEALIPVMGHRMKFLKLLGTLQNGEGPESATVALPEDSAPAIDMVVEVDESRACRSQDQQASHHTRYISNYWC